jgi:hypothetical protein
MAKYRNHYGGAPGVLPSFGIVVDSETETWTSDPPGHDIPRPMVLYFTGGDHAIGSGKQYEVYPGGRARFVKDGQR